MYISLSPAICLICFNTAQVSDETDWTGIIL